MTSSRESSPASPLITVIEPDAIAPIDRLGEWLFAAGARLRLVQLWKGHALPAVDDLGDGLVILGGTMSVNDDDSFPWLSGLRDIIRAAVADELPTVAICLGAQLAAQALGGSVVVGSPTAGENGVARLELTAAAATDRVLGPVCDEAIRAAIRAGISTADGTQLPVLVSHDDAVTALPPQATALAGTAVCPLHTWRIGRLLAFQHHPEVTVGRMALWALRDAADAAGYPLPQTTATPVMERRDAARTYPSPEKSPATEPAAIRSGQKSSQCGEDLPPELRAAEAAARTQAEAIEPVTQAFGRALAAELVRYARARAALRR